MKRILLFALLAAAAFGCATENGTQRGVALAPHGVQFDVDLEWHYPLSNKPLPPFGAFPLDQGRAVDVGGVTYATSTLGKVVAIKDSSAVALWTRDFEMPVTAGPVVSGNAVYVGLSNGAVLRLDARDGKEKWRFDAGAVVENGLSANDGLVAIVNANNRAMLLDAETGTVRWRRERPRGQEFTMYGQCAPLIDGGVVYAGFSDGTLVAYAASNGTAIWTRDLAPKERFKDLDVTPLRVRDVLYVASSSGGLYALSVDDGHTIWQKDIQGISSVSAFQDSLFVSSQLGVFRLRMSDGATIWQNEIQGDTLFSPLALGKNSIYVAVQQFGLAILDRKSGKLRHVFDMGTDFTSPPCLTDGRLSILSNRSTVYRFIVDDAPVADMM